MNMIGRIEVITGPMFSGKTSELLTKMKRVEFSKRDYLLFKPHIDTRYSDNEVVSHNKNALKAHNVSNAKDILEICEKHQHIKNIGIDEIQFLNFQNPVSMVESLFHLKRKGYQIITACLDMDALGKPFPGIPELLAIADGIAKLKAVCFECGNDAGMSHRISTSTAQIEIGEKDKYEALCFSCWHLKNPEKDSQ